VGFLSTLVGTPARVRQAVVIVAFAVALGRAVCHITRT
jgi:hypothetical protein